MGMLRDLTSTVRGSADLVHQHLRHVRWSSDYGYYLQLIAGFGWPLTGVGSVDLSPGIPPPQFILASGLRPASYVRLQQDWIRPLGGRCTAFPRPGRNDKQKIIQ
jgi:hypothetical protein